MSTTRTNLFTGLHAEVLNEIFGDAGFSLDTTNPSIALVETDGSIEFSADFLEEIFHSDSFSFSGDTEHNEGVAPSNGVVRVVAPDKIDLELNANNGRGGGGGGGDDSPGGGGGGGKGGGGGSTDDGITPPNAIVLVVPADAQRDFFVASDGIIYQEGATYSSSGFDVLVEFITDVSDDVRTAAENTVRYFTEIITNDIFYYERKGKNETKDTEISDGSLVWDDLYLTVGVENIQDYDNTGDPMDGDILASAGPSGFWPDSQAYPDAMPAMGTITFDIDDVDSLSPEAIQAIMTHEFMHVLGFGTLWGSPSVFNNFSGRDLISGTSYTGDAGNTAYNLEFDVAEGSQVPVENDGGSGTAGGHWEEGSSNITSTHADSTVLTLAEEMMTGYIDLANPNDAWLSYTSVMSLEDLGYDIAYQDYEYDNYVVPDYGLTV